MVACWIGERERERRGQEEEKTEGKQNQENEEKLQEEEEEKKDRLYGNKLGEREKKIEKKD